MFYNALHTYINNISKIMIINKFCSFKGKKSIHRVRMTRLFYWILNHWKSVQKSYAPLTSCVCVCVCVCVSCSVMSDSVTPWTIAHQATLSVGFSRQEYRSGLSFLSPEDLPKPRTEPRSPGLKADSLLSEPSGKLCTV